MKIFEQFQGHDTGPEGGPNVTLYCYYKKDHCKILKLQKVSFYSFNFPLFFANLEIFL